MVDQLNEKFPGKLVDILMLCKGHQCGMFTLYTVCQFCPFSVQPGQHIRKSDGLSLLIGFLIPVVLVGIFPVFLVLIKGLFVASDVCQFPLLRSNQFFQTDRLALFDRGGVNAGNHFRV